MMRRGQSMFWFRIVLVFLLLAFAQASAGARPATTKPVTARPATAKSSPASHDEVLSPKAKGRNYVVAFRVGVGGSPLASVWLEAPAPFVMGGVSIRSGWLELGIECMALTWNLGHRDTVAILSFGFFGYSLRRHRVRLRHGVKLGVATSLSFERHVGAFSPLPLPSISAELIGILVRLGKKMWLEIDPLNVGYPSGYDFFLALRWEI